MIPETMPAPIIKAEVVKKYIKVESPTLMTPEEVIELQVKLIKALEDYPKEQKHGL